MADGIRARLMHLPATLPTLRAFGLALAAFAALIFGTVLPTLGWLPVRVATWIWGAAAAIALFALAWPAALRPLFVAWTAVGRVLGWINTRLLLGLVFFGLIWPMGTVRRVLGRPPITKKGDPSAPSYRAVSQSPRAPDHFERPY
jgi:hypothetical protein